MFSGPGQLSSCQFKLSHHKGRPFVCLYLCRLSCYLLVFTGFARPSANRSCAPCYLPHEQGRSHPLLGRVTTTMIFLAWFAVVRTRWFAHHPINPRYQNSRLTASKGRQPTRRVHNLGGKVTSYCLPQVLHGSHLAGSQIGIRE